MPSSDVTCFLTDEDVPVGWVHAINKLASIVELRLRIEAISIHEIGRSGFEDREQLIFARDNGYVLLTCDRYRHQDGRELKAELLANGGNIVQLRGGPEQPAHQAIAKILMHISGWQDKYSGEDGIATFQSADAFRFRTPEKFAPKSPETSGAQLTEYESHPDAPRQISRRIGPRRDQGELV